MTTIKEELIDLVELATKKFAIPAIKQIYMPEPHPAPDKDSEFGILVLEDNSVGLYYAWMGEAQSGMNQRYSTREFIGLSPLDLVSYYQSAHEADRSLGLAAINAISQSVFHQSNFQLRPASNSMGELDIKAGDHVGMVGFFPSLVRRLNEQGIAVTVIEKKDKFVQKSELLNVCMDAGALGKCNKILSTASTLLNDSLDEILTHCQRAEVIVVIGPTAGFLPDPLFDRGVIAIGGSEIVDVDLAIKRLSNEQGLGNSARKYLLKRDDYPGASGLLKKE